ncbi:MAG: transposase, partial [Chloroflexi bacterium]|nr:transposase [Chloroflexota bacterium]
EKVVMSAEVAFSKRSWPFVMAFAIPWLLCAGQRSVRRLLALGGLKRSASAYYRFLSEGKWHLPRLFASLLKLIVRTFGLQQLTLVLDDTLCPKWGRSIFGTGFFYDHVRRPRAGYIWGHNWVVLAVVVPLGKVGNVALPFWIGLYRSRKRCTSEEFRTRLQMAADALTLVRACFSGPIRLLADGAYANDSLISPAAELGVELVSRLRSDARLLRARPGERAPHRPGRKPTKGPALPKLSRLAHTRSAFRSERVAIYGKRLTLLVREFEAYWPAIGRVVKVVITRDPRHSKRLAYLFTTDLKLSALGVIEAFAQRWTIEQLFSVAKLQMGLDTAEVRKPRAVVRHAALCMALITWTEVWTRQAKPNLWARTFAAKLSALRAETISKTVFSSGPRDRGSRRIAWGIASIFTAATLAA